MNTWDYPAGADTSDAPWNQKEDPEVEVDVTVSITLSKTIKVSTSNYIYEEDGEGGKYYFQDLYKDVENQYALPSDAHKYIPNTPEFASIKEQLSGWFTDDFEVIEE